MIQVKEFSQYATNNEGLTNKWIQDNDKYEIISVTPYYNPIGGYIAYVITYKN